MRHLAATALLIAAPLCLCACSDDSAAPTRQQGDTWPGARDVYEVRGTVASMPDPASPASEFSVHHEAIPTFKQLDGSLNVYPDGTPGMKSMAMPMPLAPNVDLEALGIEVGDPVAFTLEVAVVKIGERDSFRYRVSKIEPLPEGTTLDFTDPPANPDAAADPADEHDHADHDHKGHDHSSP